ncbi:MAG: GyrI-like domain-containing protein [Flavobacteriaceae bacterium]|nr:GyrI-like domain-containing protein [Flavobacteriaceae bacterium]
MEKINYKKVLKHLYNASSVKISVVDVPEINFLAIDGVGDPNTSESYAQAIEALYSVSYTLKFMLKKGPRAIDYGVMPLEGLWWTDDMAKFSQEDKSNWKWTAMIMQPDLISEQEVEEAKRLAESKKELPALPLMEFRTYKEGTCAQIMHIGPFSEEGPTIQKVHQFIQEQGNSLSGKHHEIYLSDIRRAAPEKWKTIIRQPFS